MARLCCPPHRRVHGIDVRRDHLEQEGCVAFTYRAGRTVVTIRRNGSRKAERGDQRRCELSQKRRIAASGGKAFADEVVEIVP